jgi:hypothetical protein
VRNLTEKVKAAHPLFEVRRCILLGCGFSLFGLRYSLRKPTLPQIYAFGLSTRCESPWEIVSVLPHE